VRPEGGDVSNARRFRRSVRQPVVVVPEIPEDAPARVREGLARRRLAVTTGRCPCGARLDLPATPSGTVTHVTLEHEPDCPAIDPALEQLVRQTGEQS
jgi:hypothetical protein